MCFLRSVGEACFTTESLQPRLINAWFDKIKSRVASVSLNHGFQSMIAGSGVVLASDWGPLIVLSLAGDQTPGGELSLSP